MLSLLCYTKERRRESLRQFLLNKFMPIIFALVGAGALAGYILAPSANNNLSAIEGLAAGVVIGIGAAAVYFAFKKV